MVYDALYGPYSLGSRWGHIRATSDRIAADTHGHLRPMICPGHLAYPPPSAGRRDLTTVSDTEEVKPAAAPLPG